MTNLFVDQSETTQAVLGQQAYDNFCRTGYSGKGFCVVSDKRLYFRGNYYYSFGRRFGKTNADSIVDLCSYNFSNYVSYRIVHPIISIIILILGFITAGVGWYMYEDSSSSFTYYYGSFHYYPGDPVERSMSYVAFGLAIFMVLIFLVCITKKRNLFQMVFDTGKYGLATKTLRGEDIYGFQRQLSVAKENALENRKNEQEAQKKAQEAQRQAREAQRQAQEAQRQAQAIQKTEAASNDAQVTPADELKKYAELLQAGAISQEEFEHVKKRILSNL